MSIIDDQIIEVAKFFGGDEGVKIIQVLEKLGEATDETLAIESGVKLSNVRKFLYKMYSHGLISAVRAKDEKKGWFIFYWRIQKDQLNAFIRDRKRKVLEKLKKRLEYEKLHEFFICEKCPNVRVSFEEAMESAFKCLNCGEQLKNVDNSKIIDFLTKKINQLEEELKNE
ncbi:MAG: transcription factor [Candidatus Bathyarchaeia archaeon]|nr:transcription factor [Candidatus Bathyarchaeota archaeon]